MKSLFLLLFLAASTFSWSQTNFAKGFMVGYRNASCFDQNPCIPAEPPTPPVPGVYETPNSFQDGYNRGFQLGLDDNKMSATRYRMASVEPFDFETKLNNRDTAIHNAALRQLKSRALALIQTGGYKTAIALCDLGLKSMPNDDEFVRIGASAYLQLRNYDGASLYLKKAERIPTATTATRDMIRGLKDGSIQKAVEQGKAN